MICENCFSLFSSLEDFTQILLNPYENKSNKNSEIYLIENFIKNYFEINSIEGGLECENCLKISIKKISKFIFKFPSKILLVININTNSNFNKENYFKKFDDFDCLNIGGFFIGKKENYEIRNFDYFLKSTINYFEDTKLNQRHFIA